MGKSLLDLYPEASDPTRDDELPFSYLDSREASFERLGARPGYDLLIIGAGEAGALQAYLSALNGLRVALVQPGAYLTDTSPWHTTERLSHLSFFRYVKTLRDLKRAVRARKQTAPLAATGTEITFPSGLRSLIGRIVIGRAREFDPKRLVTALLLSARQEGAVCLNYTSPTFVESDSKTGVIGVGVRDEPTGKELELRCGAIFIDPDCGILPGSRLAKSPLWTPSPSSADDGAPSVMMRGGAFIPTKWMPWEYERPVMTVLKELRRIGAIEEQLFEYGERKLSMLVPDPGAVSIFRRDAAARDVKAELIESAIKQWGPLVRHIGRYPNGFEVVSGSTLRGEVLLRRDVLQTLDSGELK